MRLLREYKQSLFLIFLFLLLFALYKSKIFSFPVHESIHFIIATKSFESSITNFWHTPIYVMLLFLFRQLFYDPFVAAHMIGLMSVYLTSFVIFRIIRRLELEHHLNSKMKYLFSLVNIIYVPIYNSIFLYDIDNTILMPFLLFFVDYFISNVKSEKKWELLLLLVILFWIKEVVFFPVVMFMLIVSMIELGYTQGVKKILPVILLSLIINLISYGLYSNYFIGNWGAITFNGGKLLSLNNTSSSTFNTMSFLGKIASIIMWGGLYLFILLLINIKEIYKNAYTKYIGTFIVFYVFVFTIPWPAESGGWPKYAIPIYPFMLIMSSFIVKEYNSKKFIGCVIFFSLIYYLLGDYFYHIYDILRYKEINYSYSTIRFIWYLLVPLSFIFLSRYLRLSKSFIIFIFFLAQNIGLLTNQLFVNYSTNYQYGTHGTEKVFTYIKKNKIENITEFPIYDGLFNQQGNKQEKKYYINRDYFFIMNRPINNSDAEILKKIKNDYKKIKQIGNYQIWEKK